MSSYNDLEKQRDASEKRHCEGGEIGFIVKLTKPVTKLTKSQRCVQRQTPRRNST